MTRGTESKNPEGSVATAPEQANAPQALLTSTVVLTRKKGRKRGRKKYSRGTKGIQRLLFGVSRAGYRTTNSLAEGLDTFVKRTNRSGRKRRDGMVRDVFSNASRGIGDGLTELGKAPREISRRFNTRRSWRMVRVLTPF